MKNPWGNSKHCLAQFSSPRAGVQPPASPVAGAVLPTGLRGPKNKASLKDFKQRLSQAKDYETIGDIAVGGAEVLEEVKRVLARRATTEAVVQTHASGRTELSSAGPASPQTGGGESHQAAAFESPRTATLVDSPALWAPSTDYVTGDVHPRVALTV